ncbi:hypothetical protein [Streptomyces sp. XY006]|uniref:hypothetical protein n=1 Tax=Streptomyces sp. XY006 TaxID=2021410 RepID=UPI0035946951
MGEDHPATLRVRMNLVIATLENGQAGEAGHLCARVVDSLRRVLGDDHQETRLARELLRDLDEREPRREASAPPVPPQRYWHSYGTSYDGGGGQSDRALKSAVEPVTWRSEPPPGTAAPAPGTVTPAYRMVSGLQDEVSRLRERLDER